MDIKLGQEARDTITGFKGVIVSRIEYLNGCVHYGLQPKADKDGIPEVEYVDAAQIEVILKKTKKKSAEKPPGGPAPSKKPGFSHP